MRWILSVSLSAVVLKRHSERVGDLQTSIWKTPCWDSGDFGFELECNLPETGQDGKEGLIRLHYSLTIYDLDYKSQNLEVHLHRIGSPLLMRKKGNDLIIQGRNTGKFTKTYAALLSCMEMLLAQLLQYVGLYRIDPISAKELGRSSSDPTKLERNGHNLVSVPNRLEPDEQVRETIMDWIGDGRSRDGGDPDRAAATGD